MTFINFHKPELGGSKVKLQLSRQHVGANSVIGSHFLVGVDFWLVSTLKDVAVSSRGDLGAWKSLCFQSHSRTEGVQQDKGTKLAVLVRNPSEIPVPSVSAPAVLPPLSPTLSSVYWPSFFPLSLPPTVCPPLRSCLTRALAPDLAGQCRDQRERCARITRLVRRGQRRVFDTHLHHCSCFLPHTLPLLANNYASPSLPNHYLGIHPDRMTPARRTVPATGKFQRIDVTGEKWEAPA